MNGGGREGMDVREGRRGWCRKREVGWRRGGEEKEKGTSDGRGEGVEVRGGKGGVMEGGRVRWRGKEKEKERGEEGR
jgi:hypothetical protein